MESLPEVKQENNYSEEDIEMSIIDLLFNEYIDDFDSSMTLKEAIRRLRAHTDITADVTDEDITNVIINSKYIELYTGKNTENYLYYENTDRIRIHEFPTQYKVLLALVIARDLAAYILGSIGNGICAVVEHLVYNIFEYLLAIMVMGSVAFMGYAVYDVIRDAKDYEKYEEATFTVGNETYDLSDIYVVYSTEDVHFCTRDIVKVTEEITTGGSFSRGTGSIGEYAYRDDIYGYYDIKTGEEICQDHQDGYYIESILNFYKCKDMKERDFTIDYASVEDEVDVERVLSRTPSPTRLS